MVWERDVDDAGFAVADMVPRQQRAEVAAAG